LLAAAAEVFAEKGYDRAGVQEIAHRAGFTTGAIYGRFRGKADFLLAAIKAQSDDEFEELFSEKGGPRLDQDKVTNILAKVGSHLVTEEFDNGKALLLEAFVAARRDPEVGGMLRHVVEERASQMAQLIEAAKRTGEVSPSLDTEAVVRFCHAVGLGFLLFGAIDLPRPKPEPWESLIGLLIHAVQDRTYARERATDRPIGEGDGDPGGDGPVSSRPSRRRAR
jgi:AcrR family transcriptional regulator